MERPNRDANALPRPWGIALAAWLLLACGTTGGHPAPDGGSDAALWSDAARDASEPGDGRADGGADGRFGDAAQDSGSDAGHTDPYGPYDTDGPHQVLTGRETVSMGLGGFELDLWVPSAAGPHPVVVLSPGFLQPAAAYAPYGQRMASHGIIVLARDDPGSFTYTTEVAADIAHTVTTWLPAANSSQSSLLHGRVDQARIGLVGHSRGGKATLLAAQGALAGQLLGWFGLDPIDSAVLSGGAMARDHMGELAIPIAYLGASVSGTCSPVGDNYEMLYALSPSPALKLTGLGAGHTQLEDPAACFSCEGCTPAGTADGAEVLDYAVRYVTAFFARELKGDASVGAGLEGAGALLDQAAGLITVEAK
ncbi:MAG: hypothetical protein RBU30_23710 [Polyangia bacterium]|nr:hypothetical protein [Polyangia bacterium]